MKNPIYLSTGCFTGRINGRDPHLLSRFFDKINCDGFELMIYDDLYPNMDGIVKEYLSLGINIPVLHMNKRIGDLCSTVGQEAFDEAVGNTKRDLEIAAALGATKCVLHPWGIPDSDSHPEMIYGRIYELWSIGKSYGIEILPENCVCTHRTPLDNLRDMLCRNDIRVCMDTRAAAFHDQVEATARELMPRIGHFHIIDFKGTPGDWEARKTIPQPGDGDIRWKEFFATLKSANYSGSLTMESSHMLPDGVACDVFNRSLDFIRENLK